MGGRLKLPSNDPAANASVIAQGSSRAIRCPYAGLSFNSDATDGNTALQFHTKRQLIVARGFDHSHVMLQAATGCSTADGFQAVFLKKKKRRGTPQGACRTGPKPCPRHSLPAPAEAGVGAGVAEGPEA